MNAISPEPIELEPCELCGCAIEDMEELIYLRAADLVTQWELADLRDRWRHTGEAPPPDSIRNGPAPEPARQSNRPAESTEYAFWHVVGLNDPDRLKAWMRDHPRDAPFLLKLLESK